MKYEITNIERYWNCHILHRIKALKDFTLTNGKEIHKGDLGGWVESEDNLSQEGLCWIYEECKMYENAKRSGNSIGYGNSQQSGHSQQYENSQQYGDSCQYDCSKQYGHSRQGENSRQFENSQQFGYSCQCGYSQQFGNSHQFENSFQNEHSCQYGHSCQFEHSCQSGYSKQYGHSHQFGHSKQLDNAKSYSTMRESGFSINRSVDDVFTFRSPTSGNLVTIIKNDMNICTGCFSGSIFWMINPDREKLPKDHWAFSLHKQILEGKFKDIVI